MHNLQDPRRAREVAAVAVAKTQRLQIDGLGLRVATRQSGGDVGEELDLAPRTRRKTDHAGVPHRLGDLVQTRVTL